MRRILPLLTLTATALFALDAFAADWPQFRHDAGRTAASAEELPETLSLQWVRELPTPTPAFPGNVRLEFDTSYEPVVLGQTMFVPSMVTESVTALDTRSGAVRWRFFAEGPVRFAPVASQGKVYFVSDDGFLYCLAASDGELLWKFRGLPNGKADRTLLGSDRLISLWPARGGPVLQDGVVYFAAGLWPGDGVYVYAVDATSGKVVWENLDSHHIPEANQDHGIAQFAGIAPQGYLAIVGDKLVVPCGAQLPALLDLKTGRLDSYHMGWGGRDGLPKGTWFVAGSGRYLCQSGDLYDISRSNDEEFADPGGRPDYKNELYTSALTRIRIDHTNHKDIGQFTQPVITSDALYENSGQISALDLTSVELTLREEAKVPANRQDDKFPDRFHATFKELWNLPSKFDVHIKTADRLYCAGPGAVAAIQLPTGSEPPKALWLASLDGTPHRLLAADGRLFVVTREGAIHAFGEKKPTSVVVHQQPAGASPPTDAWTEKADDILQATKQTEGYALVLGLESGRLVEELARQSDLYVIAIDPDAEKVERVRRRLLDAGLYGSRISLRTGDPLSYALPPYLANLIVTEQGGDLSLSAMGAITQAVYPKLRPYGGTLCLATGGKNSPAVDTLKKGPFAGMQVRSTGKWTLVSRVGSLHDAADWSHEEATAASTGASTDRFVKAPLGLLWFNAPQEWQRKPGSTMVRVSGGRVFVMASQIYAIDVFTGRRLWNATPSFKHAATDQLVAMPDAIYAAGGKQCQVLDPATGKEIARIGLPEQLPGIWQNVRCEGDYLIATSGPTVLCVERHSGDVLWQYECNRPELSLAVGGGRVYCAELFNPRRGEKEETAVKTRAFDLSSGELLWEVGSGSKVLYCQPLDLLVTAGGVYHAATGKLQRSLDGSPNPTAKQPAPLFVVDEKLLWGTVESFDVFDLNTGDRVGDQTTWVRRGCTSIRASSNLVTTRVKANAAYIDLETREATSIWNIRPACLNNLYPADGVLNAPNVLGGCTCNYTHASQAFVPVVEIDRASAGRTPDKP